MPRNNKTPGDSRDTSQASTRGQQQNHQAAGPEGAKTTRTPGSDKATAQQPGARAPAGRPRRRRVSTHQERYLVAARPTASAQTLASDLAGDPAIAVVKTIGSTNASGGYPQIAVVETTAERAAMLARLNGLFVEPDHIIGSLRFPDGGAGDLMVTPVGQVRPVVARVEDDAGRPVEGAAVCVSGHGLPAIGYTGADGRVELAVPVETIAGQPVLSVRPQRGCWPVRVSRPRLRPGEPFTVVCERIVTTFPGFPDHALDSWGARAMGFGRLPPTHRGDGIKIAIIDSGAAAKHPDLTGRVADGLDLAGEGDKGWAEDLIGTGTHQAVLISGKDDGSGVTGLAPEAELHICRTAPGGHCADLIAALDYCIDKEIDVAVVSAAITGSSALLAAKVAETRLHGTAIVAAAGDDGGPLAEPAALPGVLAVGAVGRLGTFPPDSGQAAQLSGPPTADGLFAPRFTSSGPGIDCCAPGVAIVSGLPPSSYGPMSGTATAAAHVAATAALVLAHHPQFAPHGRSTRALRNPDRVDQLFQLILASCRPLPELGHGRTGAGMPDAPPARRRSASRPAGPSGGRDALRWPDVTR